MDKTIELAALAGAEKIINSALQYDPATRSALTPLTGKVLALDIKAPALRFYLVFTATELKLHSCYEDIVDVTVTGSLIALLRLTQTDIHNLKDTGVSVTGDLNLLAQMQKLINNLDIDWEEILCQFSGDILGHQAAQLIRANLGWMRARRASIQRLTSEFLTEEFQALPSKVELENFYQQIDELRLDFDRVAARAEKIIQEKLKS